MSLVKVRTMLNRETLKLHGPKRPRIDLTSEQEITFTEANHVHISGNVVINGIEYGYSTHLYYVEGKWLPLSAIDESSRVWDDVYLHAPYPREVTDNARKKGYTEIPSMMAEVLEAIDCTELRTKAEDNHLNEKYKSLLANIAAMEETLNSLKEKRIALEKKMDLVDEGVLPPKYIRDED